MAWASCGNIADGRNLPIRWSKAENIRWSIQLPGWGTSSPVVFGERVFVTSQAEDLDRKSLLLLCFDRGCTLRKRCQEILLRAPTFYLRLYRGMAVLSFKIPRHHVKRFLTRMARELS